MYEMGLSSSYQILLFSTSRVTDRIFSWKSSTVSHSRHVTIGNKALRPIGSINRIHNSVRLLQNAHPSTSTHRFTAAVNITTHADMCFYCSQPAYLIGHLLQCIFKAFTESYRSIGWPRRNCCPARWLARWTSRTKSTCRRHSASRYSVFQVVDDLHNKRRMTTTVIIHRSLFLGDRL